MGLFSFVKSAGRKVGLFGGQKAAEAEEAARKAVEASQAAAEEAQKQALRAEALGLDITAAIQSYGIVIEGLSVGLSGDTVTLSGTATSQADAEKAILIAGNTEGIAAVDSQLVVEVPEPPAQYHTVESGDTLSKVALAQYGNMHLYNHIFDANRPMLSHPDEIYPGQVLRVPPLSGATHTVASGDTLGTIAKHYYGNASRYTDIFNANRDQLSSPDVVQVGQVLNIPLSGPAVHPDAGHADANLA